MRHKATKWKLRCLKGAETGNDEYEGKGSKKWKGKKTLARWDRDWTQKSVL